MRKRVIGFFAMFMLVAGTFAQSNYVLNFNGTSDYVNLGSNAGNGILSIEFWFMPAIDYNSSLSLPASLIARNTNDLGEVGEFSIFIGPYNWAGYQGRLCFSVNGITHAVYSDNNSWQAKVWHHVACVINTVSGMEMYIDGVKQTSTNPSTSATNVRTEITAIAMWGDNSNRFFNGAIDEVRFWTRPLTQLEIQQKMCLGLNPSNEAGLVGYWKMNEGSGSVINDTTSNGYNGTISGATFDTDNYCTAGIIEGMPENRLTISPNPFNLSATLQFSKDVNNAQLYIFNMYGQEVRIIDNISGAKFTIDRTNLQSGIYFIRLMQDNKIVTTDKIIITD